MNGNTTNTTMPARRGRRAAEPDGGAAAGSRRRSDRGGEGGYILVTLGLMIIPLMAFAALAVDVGSWYARTTELQKAADAAALAGVVWAPDYSRAEAVAAKTLSDNGFTATGVASQTNGNITITMGPGGQINSFTVTITDSKAPAFFAKVFNSNSVSLTRSATAVYYLPVPMGSPLAYFGGMASKYGTNNPQTSTTNSSGSSPYPPTNVTGNPSTTYTNTLRKNSKGNYACQVDPAYAPPNPGVGWKYMSTTGTGTNTKPTGASVPSPLPTCMWDWTSVTTTTTYPQPITYTSPEFWANIMAPESSANNGDVYSPKCYGGNDCVESGGGGTPGTQTNNSYRSTGYTYTITVPSTASAQTLNLQVFDAGLYDRGNQQTETGDNIDSGTNWTTEYQVYHADSTPLDATDNPPMSASDCGGSSGVQTPNSGHWALASGDAAATFKNQWVSLCTFNALPGEIYYLRVKTTHSADSATWGSGSNRYALQVLGSGTSLANVQLGAYGDMAIYNNTPAGDSQFYLAQVGPQYAGKTLDVDLWDPGDAAGTATMTVLPPTGYGSASCTWYSEYGQGYSPSSPPPGNNVGGSPSTPTSQTSTISPCAIVSHDSSGSHFNGLWLHIRVPIPTSYSTCDPSVPLGCWWKINYNFNTSGSTDNTVWSAHIEGDPIHLTQ